MFWKDTITLLLPFAETETHSPSEDQRPANSSSPKKSAAMFCSIRVKLLKSTDRVPSATDAPRAKSTECSLPDTVKAQPDDFQNKTGDNIALNGLPDLNSSPRRASLPETIPEMEPNDRESSKIVSGPCTVATPAIEEEEEEGNVFRMFRSKNNNTFLDALCDSLIKEGVTRKFASKNFDENDDNSAQKKSGTIPCPKCDSTFSKLRYLKDHIKRKHDVYECPVCGDKSFNSHVGVEKHMRRAHNTHGEYLKKAMNVRELHREPVASLKEDSLDASQDDSESCEVNGNEANGTPGHCNDDIPPVTTAASEQSSEDQDLCDDNSSVEMGKRKVKGTGTILCPHCPAMFSAQRNLKDHIKRKHLTFMCPICGEDNFVSQKGVERHMSRVHAEETSLPIRNACLDQLCHTNISHNSDSGSLADSSHEHSDASGYQDVPAELAWGNFSETNSRRKSKPFQIALGSVMPPFSQINTEFVHDSSEEWAGEPKKKKQRGMGTIPCPQCTSTFSEYRYLKDHLRRKHVRIECTVCGDTNFYSYKGLQRHMQTLHSQSDVSPLVKQSGKDILYNSKDVIQSVPRQVNGNSQPDEAIIIPDDPEGHQTLKSTSNLKGNEIPEDTQDENKIQGNRRLGRRKLSTPVGRGKRKSEAQKSPDVPLEKESKGESVEINRCSEPKKKKRKRQSDVQDGADAGDSEEEHRTTPNTKKKGSNKKAAEKKKPVAVEVVEPQDESVADESDEEWLTVESKKQKRKKSRGTGTIPCPRCDSTFSKARYLRDHIKRKHDISVCPICGDKNFYSQRGVDRHIQTVHGGHVQK